MEKSKLYKSYLLLLGNLTMGIILLITAKKFPLPNWINTPTFLLIAFLLLNLIYLLTFKLSKDFKTFWSLHKTPFLLWGFIAGILIALSPILIGLLSTQVSLSELSINPKLSISSIGITFMIVSWEELWFRGLFLNHCKKYISPIRISISIGLLFTLVHLLNPNIDLLKTGPTLFFAGALLTILYFYYKNFWFPLTFHFDRTFIYHNEVDFYYSARGFLGKLEI